MHLRLRSRTAYKMAYVCECSPVDGVCAGRPVGSTLCSGWGWHVGVSVAVGPRKESTMSPACSRGQLRRHLPSHKRVTQDERVRARAASRRVLARRDRRRRHSIAAAAPDIVTRTEDDRRARLPRTHAHQEFRQIIATRRILSCAAQQRRGTRCSQSRCAAYAQPRTHARTARPQEGPLSNRGGKGRRRRRGAATERTAEGCTRAVVITSACPSPHALAIALAGSSRSCIER